MLAREMQARHRNLFHTMSRDSFDVAIRDLKRRIPALRSLQIVMELARIVAMVRDGHTRIVDYGIPLRRYPLRLYYYSDGIFIQSAHRRYREAVGARLVRIGRVSVDEAVAAVAEVVPRDNEPSLRDRLAWRLVTPEILRGLGLVDDMDRAQYELERDGRRWSIEVGTWQVDITGHPHPWLYFLRSTLKRTACPPCASSTRKSRPVPTKRHASASRM